MSGPSGADSTHLVIRDRCQVLGVPTWRFDARGVLVEPPCESGALGSFLRAPIVERAVTEAAAAWLKEETPTSMERFPGLRLVPLVESRRRKRSACVVACLIGPGLVGSEAFGAICAEAGLSEQEAAAALGPVSAPDSAGVTRLALCLSWIQGDLEAGAQHVQAIGGFSRQLAESYEEISLLYKLGQSMNQLAHPQKFVALACEELQATLSYSWIAVRFSPDRDIARAMAGRLFWRGDLPCDRDRLEAETARLLLTVQPKSPAVLAADRRGPLGRGQAQLLVQPVERNGRVVAAIFAGDKNGDDQQVSSTDIKLIDAAAASMSVLLDNAILYDDQERMFVGTLEALTATIDAKDPYTCGHSQRVAELAGALAAAHGLQEDQVERIRLAGVVHDVGKIGVPESVLCKTGRLTDDEFGQIKMHPEIGYQILQGIPQFEDLLPGVLYHHERFDGRGYPRGLVGRDTPLMARIIGLVDAFDAMSSNRTYRSAMARTRVFEELQEHRLTQFDPELVESFSKVDLTRYDDLVEKHQAESEAGGLLIRRRKAA
ncbi:MAG: HD-GYP domain-containing protein [Planctomycetota bacterium]|nr:HD-GYP domain-containing protein [Planctomycetota bacterium]